MSPLARSDVLEVEVGSALLLYDPAAAQAHTLNSTAALVWRECQEATSEDAVVDALLAAFTDDDAMVARDARTTLASLRSLGLLGAPPPGPAIEASPLGDHERAQPGPGAYTTSTFRVLSQDLAFRCVEPQPAAAIDDALAPLVVDAPAREWFDLVPVGDATEVWWNDRLIQSHRHATDVVTSLPYLMNRLAIDHADAVVLHAAGAADGQRVVVLPAEPDAGKSTLVAALVEAGLGYLSDEAVGVRLGTGELLVYPKRISLDAGSLDLFPNIAGGEPGPDERRHLDPRQFQPDALSAIGSELTLALCVFPTYRDGASLSYERLSVEDAALALAHNTFNLRATGQAGLETVARVGANVPCYRLEHGDVRAAVGLVRDLLAPGGT